MLNEAYATGQNAAWSLVNRLGEGDAGEVFAVETLLGSQRSILKRPRRSAFAGDTIRQSSQIRLEGQILAALQAGLNGAGRAGIRVPAVVDTSKPGTEYSERYFIVIEEAPGLDLAALLRVAQRGAQPGGDAPLPSDTRLLRLLDSIAAAGRVPDRVLLRALAAVQDLLAAIHTLPVEVDGKTGAGVIWNDVKPGHIFWDAHTDQVTFIDWGNAQLLTGDGVTADRRFTRQQDITQFIDSIGRFLTSEAPDLAALLRWPAIYNPGATSEQELAALGERIRAAWKVEQSALESIRQREADLLAQAGEADPAAFAELEHLHALILAHGALPDYSGAMRFAGQFAARWVNTEDISSLVALADWAGRLPAETAAPWELVTRLAQLAQASQGPARQAVLRAIAPAIERAWDQVHWHLMEALQDQPEPDSWQDLLRQVRGLALPAGEEPLPPRVAANRYAMSLQTLLRQAGDPPAPGEDPLAEVREAARRLREEALPAWMAVDPSPPFSTLLYNDVQEILAVDPGVYNAERIQLQRALGQPEALVQLALDAWERRDAAALRQALRRQLLWDPDRRRVFRAAQAAISAQGWLDRLLAGPGHGEALGAWLMDVEFAGRELRNQVGPASWLDRLLDACKQLRQGTWPGDLFSAAPHLVVDMPWISRFERADRRPPANGSQSTGGQSWAGVASLLGMRQVRLGADQDLHLLGPLDSWAPEARGSSARVFLGSLLAPDGRRREAAIKFARMEHLAYALPLFAEEVRILTCLADVPGVMRLIEFGFVRLNNAEGLPGGPAPADAQALTGDVIRMGTEASAQFLQQLEIRPALGWIPYLALERHPQENNLMLLADAGHTHGRFLPMPDLVQIGIQLCEILDIAHRRSIVYRDHKILHYYWDSAIRGVHLIDWNVGRLHPEGLSELEIHMDLVQFAARGLHHILTGRAAPGALPLGPTRPEEIEAAAQTYTTQWTYDDQRLSQELRTTLENALAGQYTSALQLRDDLKLAFMHLGAE